MIYKKYLQSQHWNNVKNNYYVHNPKECYICGSPEYINLHHKTYKRLGEEREGDLISLCKDHHKECHELIQISKLFGFYTNLKTIVKKLKKSYQKGTDLRNSWYKALQRSFYKETVTNRQAPTL